MLIILKSGDIIEICCIKDLSALFENKSLLTIHYVGELMSGLKQLVRQVDIDYSKTLELHNNIINSTIRSKFEHEGVFKKRSECRN